MILESLPLGAFQANCYVAASREGGRAVIIDPGDEERKIRRLLDKHSLTAGIVVNTHGHVDHIGCDDALAVPVYVHRLDAPLLRDSEENLSGFLATPLRVRAELTPVDDGSVIECDGVRLEVLHTPGHSPGGMCLLWRQEGAPALLFSGDTLFWHSVGRTDFPGADEETLLAAIKEKLLVLPDDTLVYPGHGPRTTIGRERKGNPFLR